MHEEVLVGRIAAAAIGAPAIGIAIIGGEGLNVSSMVGLAFAVAARANFPALPLALTWRRFNTAGAVTGLLFGVLSAIVLAIISPKVWPGADGEGGALSFYDLATRGSSRSRSGSSAAAGHAPLQRARQRTRVRRAAGAGADRPGGRARGRGGLTKNARRRPKVPARLRR